MTDLRMKPVAINLAGVVETPQLDSSPYRIDRDGRPYVPTGDGGIVLGVQIGDDVFGADADHAAPGACLVHAEQPARHALTSFACLGNSVEIRSGAAAGERGVVLGKRGEEGRVIACFADEVLGALAPGDAVAVRAFGQGMQSPAALHGAGVLLMNVSPDALSLLPIDISRNAAVASVRAVLPSSTAGNGVGRPAHQWDLDLQVQPADVPGLRLGDLVALEDVDVRHNAGYRKGWLTVGIIVHGSSPQPGHGPGLMPVLCGPVPAVIVHADAAGHTGVTREQLLAHQDVA